MDAKYEFNEVAFGGYNGCDRCGMSSFFDGWDCVCDLLIDAGNCSRCLKVPSYCRCPPTLLGQDGVDYSAYNNYNIYNITPTSPETPPGYQRVVHRYRTEFLPLGHPVAYTPGFSL